MQGWSVNYVQSPVDGGKTPQIYCVFNSIVTEISPALPKELRVIRLIANLLP